MLDQNTDRMWYVIGAVIVGAAMIFLMNGIFPGLFGTIGETFEDKTSSIVEDVKKVGNSPTGGELTDGVGPDGKPLTTMAFVERNAKIVDYDEISDTWTLDLLTHASKYSYGFKVEKGSVAIPYGKTLTISYEVWSPVDGFAVPDVNNSTADDSDWGLTVSDNDNVAERRFNGTMAIPDVDYVGSTNNPSKQLPVKANEWTKITFSSSNTSSENVEKVDLFDTSNIGLHNATGDVLRIQIRNIKAVLR